MSCLSNQDRKVISIIPDNNNDKKEFNDGSIFLNGNNECPLANININPSIISKCPYHKHRVKNTLERFLQYSESLTISNEIPVILLDNKEYKPTRETSYLLRLIGGGDKVREYCTRFYAHAFLDYQIGPFFFNQDGPTRHAKRLGDWIIEQMGGEGTPWIDSGRWGSRDPNHEESWHNTKRAPEKRGVPFDKTDARCWIRLHLWSMRECKLDSFSSFWKWYLKFISSAMLLYNVNIESTIIEDDEWSSKQTNIDLYLHNKYHMIDICEK